MPSKGNNFFSKPPFLKKNQQENSLQIKRKMSALREAFEIKQKWRKIFMLSLYFVIPTGLVLLQLYPKKFLIYSLALYQLGVAAIYVKKILYFDALNRVCGGMN
jgi:hypothetical protein